jgi:hypothetical protein
VEPLESRITVTHTVNDHIHAFLGIYLLGEPVIIPANVGIPRSGILAPHTHEPDNVLHLEPFLPPLSRSRVHTLGDFFDRWRSSGAGASENPDAAFSRTRLMDRTADATTQIVMTVNGRQNTQFDRYVPEPGDIIVASFERAGAVNNLPTVNAQTVDVARDTPTAFTLTGDDGDLGEQQPLRFILRSDPRQGTLSTVGGAPVRIGTEVGAVLFSPNLVYTPRSGFTGTDGIDVVVVDSRGVSAPATVTFDVRESVTPIANPQNANVVLNVPRSITLTASGVEQPSFAVQTLPTNGTLRDSAGVTVTPGTNLPGPTLTYAPNPDFLGSDRFSFTARSDGQESAPATVSINVRPNQAPTATSQNASVVLDTPRSITLGGDDGDDGAQQALSFRVQILPTNGTLRDSAGNAVTAGAALPSPNLTYTPNAGFMGNDAFGFNVQDSGGTAMGGQDTSTSAMVTISVSANQAPTASAQTVNVRQGVARTITLGGDDGDVGIEQALTFRVQTLPTNGTLQNPDGDPVTVGAPLDGRSVVYTPNGRFTGTDNFTFDVQDDGGGNDTSRPATVTLNVANFQSKDPNDLLGPAGFGPEHAVAVHEALPFTIRFENDASATAPAQEIRVTAALDPDLDWTTFSVGDIGFGQTRVSVPAGTQEFHTTVDIICPDGYVLQVAISAGLDFRTGIATWSLRAVDPATGTLPEDPLSGFLHPNDITRAGEGFLQYTVRPRADANPGTVIDSSASIVFDTNSPLPTNKVCQSIAVAEPN